MRKDNRLRVERDELQHKAKEAEQERARVDQVPKKQETDGEM